LSIYKIIEYLFHITMFLVGIYFISKDIMSIFNDTFVFPPSRLKDSNLIIGASAIIFSVYCFIRNKSNHRT